MADRRGDVYNLQGKKAEAKAEYTKAYKGFDERSEYRRLVEVKLSALGVDPQQIAGARRTGRLGRRQAMIDPRIQAVHAPRGVPSAPSRWRRAWPAARCCLRSSAAGRQAQARRTAAQRGADRGAAGLDGAGGGR